MRIHSVLLGVIILLTSAAASDEPKVDAKEQAKEQAKKLAGTWLKTNDSGTETGREEDRVVIEGEKLLLYSGGKVIREFTFKLDPAASPNRIELTGKINDAKPSTSLGIIELKGDSLRICVAQVADAERPTEFKAPSMSRALLVLKRKK